MTLQKDKTPDENAKKRVNIRKIVSLDEMISKQYSEVTIELTENVKN